METFVCRVGLFGLNVFWIIEFVVVLLVVQLTMPSFASSMDAVNDDEECLLVAQDLNQFFDSIHIDHFNVVARGFGAPPQFIMLIDAFYADNWRVCSCRGVLAKQ